MKKFLFSAIILVLSLNLFAQPAGFNDLYYDYKGEEGVVALRIPGFVMKLAGALAYGWKFSTEALAGVTKSVGIDGRRVKVKVPQGIADGTKVRLTGKGEPGANGGPAGDLFVRVHVAQHPIFERVGKRDLKIDVPITIFVGMRSR